MNKNTASSPTDSGGTGMSKPVFRKGIICFKSCGVQRTRVLVRKRPSAMSEAMLGVVEGMEVEVLEEAKGFYKVRLFGGDVHPDLVGYIPSHFVKEVQKDGK